MKRFRFDMDLYKRCQSPWKDVGFAAHGANGFEMEIRPLGEGAGEFLLHQLFSTHSTAACVKPLSHFTATF